MTVKTRFIASALGASLLAMASLAAAQTSGPTSQGSDQQTPVTRAQASEQLTRIAQQCIRMMGPLSQ